MPANAERPPHIAIDLDGYSIELFGVKYSLELFRVFAMAPIGTVLRIVERKDKLVTVETMQPAPKPNNDSQPVIPEGA